MRHWNYPSSRRGFLFLEVLVVLLLLSAAVSTVLPRLYDWQEERELEAAAAEVAAAVRMAEASAKNGTGGVTSDETRFLCNGGTDGRVTYKTFRKRGGAMAVSPPSGRLPENITADGQLYLTFWQDGFTGRGSRDYQVHLSTKDRKYTRTIIVQMYTGRVRIVEGWGDG